MDEMKHSQEKIRQLWWVYFIPLILGLMLRRSEGFVLVTILLIWSSFLVSVFTWIYSIWVFKKYWPEMVTKISPNLKVDDQTTEGKWMVFVLRLLHAGSSFFMAPGFVGVFLLGWQWSFSICSIGLGLIFLILGIVQYTAIQEYLYVKFLFSATQDE